MRIASLSFVFALLVIAPAAAQTAGNNCPHPTAQKAPPSAALVAARHTERQACAADMAKFCANVPRGCGRPMQCLRAHTTELSSACTGAMAQVRAARMQSH